MTGCVTPEQGSGRFWTRCANVLTQLEPCRCAEACTDSGMGPWCWIAPTLSGAPKCELKNPCPVFSKGQECATLDSNGRAWTRCANVLNGRCTRYPVEYPMLANSQAFLLPPPAQDPLGAADPPSIGAVSAQEYAARHSFEIRHEDQVWIGKRVLGLRKLTALLTKYHVPYFLHGGTLVGAYRHGRSVPWDDDVDIAIPIKYQRKLLGVVKNMAAKEGISLMQSWLNPEYDYYKPIVTYIQKIAPKMYPGATPWDQYKGTKGYFCQGWFQGVKIDIWMVFPVVLDGMVLYSYGGGLKLFGREELFPAKPCAYEGFWYKCPARTHGFLSRIYQDLSVPQQINWNAAGCKWDYNSISATKFKNAPPEAAPQVYLDAQGNPHMKVPPAFKSLVDPVDGYNDLGLGYGPGVTPPGPGVLNQR